MSPHRTYEPSLTLQARTDSTVVSMPGSLSRLFSCARCRLFITACVRRVIFLKILCPVCTSSRVKPLEETSANEAAAGTTVGPAVSGQVSHHYLFANPKG